ncbi:Protein BATH-36 [Aphelenchoides avenae]|nr:Protein BATH-36 [Aphelenchus avenae]
MVHVALMKDLLKPSNGYLKNGKITIECRIAVTLPAVNEAADGLLGVKRRCTDVKIVMGDRHIYANRGALAVHCGYFDAAFNGGFDDAEKDELRLDDVNADHFADFLKVVYRGHVHASNVAAVAPLADRLQAAEILQECERVLVNDMRPRKAIPILEKCGGLDDLKKQLLEGLSLQDLKELTTADMLRQFCKETVVHLLNEYKRRFDSLRA